MKPTTLLLTTAAAGAALRPRPRLDNSPQRPRALLLHSLPASGWPPHSPNTRLLAAESASSPQDQQEESESTQGGAFVSLDTIAGTANDDDAASIASVQATLRIPRAEIPSAGPAANNTVGVYAASFWVGIGMAGGGGSNNNNNNNNSSNKSNSAGCSARSSGGVLLRAGIDIFYDGSAGGVQPPFAWYQFTSRGGGGGDSTPGFAHFSAAAGDLVRITVAVRPPVTPGQVGKGNGSGASSGVGSGPGSGPGDEKEAHDADDVAAAVVTMENFGGNATWAEGAAPLSTARQVIPNAQMSGSCRREAAWVVEDFPLGGMPDVPVPLANFTSVTFGEVAVTLDDGSVRDAAGAEVRDVKLQAQGGRLTSCELVGGRQVRCRRVLGDS